MNNLRKHLNTALFGSFTLLLLIISLAMNKYEVRALAPEDSLVPLDTSFTYQGYLENGGQPVDGACDIRFQLYDDLSGGTQIASNIERTNIAVYRGVFSTRLDFGNAFTRQKRWLSIAVRCPAGSGNYTTLSPRTEVTASPFANGLPNMTIEGSTGRIGINNNSFPYTYGLDVKDTFRSLGSYVTTEHGGIRGAMLSNANGGVINVQAGSMGARAQMGVDSSGAGYVDVRNNSTSVRANMFVNSAGAGGFSTYGANGNVNAFFNSLNNYPNNGAIGVADSAGNNRAIMLTASDGGGYIDIYGPNGNRNVNLYSLNNYPDNGYIGVANSSGSNRATMFTGSGGGGFVNTYGPNGNVNAFFTSLNNYANNGYIGVANSSGTTRGRLYVNSSGNGVISVDTSLATVHQTVTQNTFDTASEEKAEIWYTSLQGSEAGAYLRGTAQLVNGKATIVFPEHFLAVASEEGMTVQVTPLSADSLGLAVIHKRLSGVSVQELYGGTGTYEFDFFITAVRRGHEQYQVFRPADSDSALSDMTHSDMANGE